MLRRLLIMPAILLTANGGFVAAQDRFELTVPGTTTQSTAELTASSLSINHQGNVSVYTRETRFDVLGYLGFTSTTLDQIILWPSKGTGSMQIATIPKLGAPVFRTSQMQITRVAAPIGTAPAPPRSGLVDTTRSYRLTNEFLGKTRSLAADTKGATVMDRSDDFVEQAWKFVPIGKETYRLTNVAWGDGYSLTANGRDSQPTMERTDPRSKAQLWTLTKEGTAFRLTNEDLGAGWSLDNVGSGSNEPVVFASGNFGGQFWTFTELATIVGTWEEIDVTNKPKGITVDIWVDVTRKEVAFRQTEKGKRDLVGTVELVKDLLTLNPTGSAREQYLVALKSDRIDFQDLSRRPTGFSWRRIGTGPAMKLTSPAFASGAAIPAKYTGAGDDVSPPLSWSDAPVGTKSFALICEDPDAPSRTAPRPEGPWVHWVVYNIPANARELPAAVARKAEPAQPAGARQGMNDFDSDNVGYGGPMPPKGSGPHRYFFRIYALDGQLNLAAKDATKKSLLAAMSGHVLAEGELMGTFEYEGLSPRPVSRLVSRKVVPNPPLEPVTIELANSHSEELWVLVRDLRGVTQAQQLKIPSKKSASIEFERDAGSTIVEEWEIATGSLTETVERVTDVPPKQLYDISVYELFVQSIYIDRTKKGGGKVEDVDLAPKSVGLINVPAGDRFNGGKTDIYAAAKRQKNPGDVGRIDPAEWRESVPKNDPLQDLLPRRR